MSSEAAVEKATKALSASKLPNVQNARLHKYYSDNPKEACVLPNNQDDSFLTAIFKLKLASLNNPDQP